MGMFMTDEPTGIPGLQLDASYSALLSQWLALKSMNCPKQGVTGLSTECESYLYFWREVLILRGNIHL